MQARTTNRRRTNIVLDCRVPARREQAILCDVSETGCRIELFDGTAQKGSTIVFEIDADNQFAGQVVWVRGSEAGVHFSHKLSPAARNMLEL